MLNIEKFMVRLALVTPMLGTVPKDPEVYKAHIATKKEEYLKNKGDDVTPEDLEKYADEEAKTVEKTEEKGWTGFHVDDEGYLFLRDYMIRGFLKSACEVLVANGAMPKITAYKKWIDRMVFIEPENIRIYNGTKGECLKLPDDFLERPLRTMTPKGERVTVARSDTIDAGRTLSFKVVVLKNDKGLNEKSIRQMLEYGQFVGLGQWRGSGGYGKFKVVE